MAIVTTTIVPVLTLFPWQSRTGVQDTLKPVAELMANSRDEAITLSGTGDTQETRWSVMLPPNFTYILKDFSASIDIAATNTWEDLQSLIYFDTVSGGSSQTFEYGIGLKSEGVARRTGTTSQEQVYRPIAPLPSFMQVGGGLWTATFVDLTTEEGAANFNCTARFLVYTIAQQFDVQVNTPLLTR